METTSTAGRGVPTPQCPLRPGEPCTLCQVDVSGPHDCPLVYLAMSDPELREQLRPDRRRGQDD